MRAVLAAEDAAFWSHDGVDYGELRASFDWSRLAMDTRGVDDYAAAGQEPVFCLPRGTRPRKFEELVIARRLEAELSKTRILELYVNVVEWGDGIWGAEAAARTSFNVAGLGLVALRRRRSWPAP